MRKCSRSCQSECGAPAGLTPRIYTGTPASAGFKDTCAWLFSNSAASSCRTARSEFAGAFGTAAGFFALVLLFFLECAIVHLSVRGQLQRPFFTACSRGRSSVRNYHPGTLHANTRGIQSSIRGLSCRCDGRPACAHDKRALTASAGEIVILEVNSVGK